MGMAKILFGNDFFSWLWPQWTSLWQADFIGMEFWVSFLSTLILLGSPWMLYLLWIGHRDVGTETSANEGPPVSVASITAKWPEDLGDTAGATESHGVCQVVANPTCLFRAAEYNRYSQTEGKESLTAYDMALTANDHQALFSSVIDAGGDKALEIAQTAILTAWTETDSQQRLQLARHAISMSENCVGAYILLAEEGSATIQEARAYLAKCVGVAERQLLKRCPTIFTQHSHELWKEVDTRPYVYAKRRLGMCLDKLGKHKEAAKIFKELSSYSSVATSTLFVQANHIKTLIDLGLFTEAQSVIDKNQACFKHTAMFCYTSALVKVLQCPERFSLETAAEQGLSMAEVAVTEALDIAIEFNPHVPKYLLEQKSLTLPPEHIVLRGDSEAVAYAFEYLKHWQSCKGSLELLHLAYESFKKNSSSDNDHKFGPYPRCVETADRRLLPEHHIVSVYSAAGMQPETLLLVCLVLLLAAVFAPRLISSW